MHWDVCTVFSVITGAGFVVAGLALPGVSVKSRIYAVIGGGFFFAYGLYVVKQTSGTYYFPVYIFAAPIGAIIALIIKFSSANRTPQASIMPKQRPDQVTRDPSAGMTGVEYIESRPSGNRVRTAGGTGSADGTIVLLDWLDQLAAMQPQHGPLLQRTLDGVGKLPAVSNDGCIDPVGDLRYWAAVAYTQAFASGEADNRRVAALLAEAEARRRNEPSTVRKQAEAVFWESVRQWIDPAAPAQMVPYIMPR